MMRSRPIPLVLAAGFFLALPCLLRGPLPNAKDGVIHWNRAEAFIQQFWEGEPYPRWLRDMNASLGSPVPFVYPPGSYHLSALLAPFTSAPAWNRTRLLALDLVLALGLVLSGAMAYRWLRAMVPPWPAALGAIAYTAAPYHVWVDAYIRYAIAENLALATAPMAMLGAWRTAKRLPGGVPLLAAGFGLTVLSHLFSALLLTPFLAASLVVFSAPRTWRRSVLQGLLGGLLGAGLSAIYLLPALSHERFLSAEAFVRDPHYDFRNSFLVLTSRLLIWDGTSAAVAWYATWMAIAGLAVAFSAWRIASPELRRKLHSGFWLAVCLAAFLMMTSWSKPLWEALPVLPKLQYPWRFHIILLLAMTPLLAGAFASWNMKSETTSQRWLRPLFLFLLPAMILPWVAHIGWLYMKNQPVQENYQHDREARANDMRRLWVPSTREELFHSRSLLEFSRGVALLEVHSGGQARLVSWRPRQIEIALDGAGSQIQLKHFLYPTWRAETLPERTPLALTASPNGLMMVNTPAGCRRVRVFLPYGWEEIVGAVVSGVSLMVLVVWLLRVRSHLGPAH